MNSDNGISCQLCQRHARVLLSIVTRTENWTVTLFTPCLFVAYIARMLQLVNDLLSTAHVVRLETAYLHCDITYSSTPPASTLLQFVRLSSIYSKSFWFMHMRPN